MNKMFTYGTLMDNSIRLRVLGKETIPYPAELSDYVLTNHSYSPFLTIKKSIGDIVKGVMFEVNDDDIKNLDRYENNLYNKIIVNVKVNYNSSYESLTYIEKNYNQYLTQNPIF